MRLYVDVREPLAGDDETDGGAVISLELPPLASSEMRMSYAGFVARLRETEVPGVEYWPYACITS